MLRQIFAWIAQVIFFTFVAWLLGLVWFISQIPTEPSHDTQKTDAVVVLTGGALRLEKGFELLANNRAEKMFISGVEDGVTLQSLLNTKEYQAYANHFSPERVELGYHARSTIGNAEETAQWLADEEFHTIRLVTGSYHMPRSLLQLHYAIPTITIVPEPVFPPHFEGGNWWRYPDSVALIFSEYHKYLASIIVYPLLSKST